MKEFNKIAKTIRICVIPTSTKHHPAAHNLAEILKRLLSEGTVYVLDYPSFIAKAPKLAKLPVYALDELIISIKLLKVLSRVNLVLIFQKNHLLPAFVVRLSRKKLILFVGGSAIADSLYREQTSPSLLSNIICASNILLSNVSKILPHKIVTITPFMVSSVNLGRYQEKTCSAPIFPSLSHGSLFDIKMRYDRREQVIGFVGSLEKIKGIINFVEAVPYIHEQLDNVHIVIIGNGTLGDNVKLRLKEYCVSGAVEILEWASYTMLPNYYNDFKLLVLPSYSEGVPSVMLEAMSCGTPVLATPVGGIPDIVKDCETGFLLESNDPKHIADKIVELLNKPELLEKVSRNAYKWVKENFSEEKTIKAWQKILKQLKKE